MEPSFHTFHRGKFLEFKGGGLNLHGTTASDHEVCATSGANQICVNIQALGTISTNRLKSWRKLKSAMIDSHFYSKWWRSVIDVLCCQKLNFNKHTHMCDRFHQGEVKTHLLVNCTTSMFSTLRNGCPSSW